MLLAARANGLTHYMWLVTPFLGLVEYVEIVPDTAAGALRVRNMNNQQFRLIDARAITHTERGDLEAIPPPHPWYTLRLYMEGFLDARFIREHPVLM